jgi:hypothetical protein
MVGHEQTSGNPTACAQPVGYSLKVVIAADAVKTDLMLDSNS